ncbi:MAG: hypothetical protein PHH60_05005 [Candidatus Margulisbacteria bacterium]|nr:hypothetical protein [Candidatus Margulisiibacteriota bacterium]
MGIIEGCKTVLHYFGTDKMKVAWLKQGKLAKREVLTCALSKNLELRKMSWEVLNQHPSLIVDLVGRDDLGRRCFSSDIERLFRRPDAKPATIAKVLAGLILEPFKKGDLDRAVRILKFHQVRGQGDILSELGMLNQALFEAIRRAL